MTIERIISERRITEILHFTTHKGLVGVLAKGFVLSRRRLNGDQYLEHILHPNATIRPEESILFDKSQDWLDFVNLSISQINSRFFRICREWGNNSGVWWVILSFDPVLMADAGVYFATTNNSYEYCNRNNGVSGLSALFAPVVPRKGDWRAQRGSRAENLPTCEQAEVLYEGALPLTFLRRIYVMRTSRGDLVRGWLREFEYVGVEVEVNPSKFIGVPN